MLDVIFFGALPYVSISVLLIVSIQRYRKEPFSFSSLSSQFLESRRLFWGSVPFHVGILTLFVGHLVGFLIPAEVTAWNREPVRLLVLETAALAAGLLALFGLVALIWRRIVTPRLRVVTSAMDVVVYLALLFSVITGLWVALGFRWGSAWYAQVATPYLRSVLLFQPDVARVAVLPWIVKLHIISAWVVLGVLAFSRLVHILVAPVPYFWRPVQQVIWNRPRSRPAEVDRQ